MRSTNLASSPVSPSGSPIVSPVASPHSPRLIEAALGLEVNNVSLAYDNNKKGGRNQQPILNNISLSVPPGKTLALLGPSGCGKTSLLRSIAGLETPLSGEISMGDSPLFQTIQKNGKTIIKKNIRPEHRKVGMIFQDLALFPHLTVAKNLAYGLSSNKSSAGKERLVRETLELVGLSGYEDRRISTLSGGEQQRVALARALAPKPKVLLLDEPFSSLDEPTRVELRSHINRLLAQLKTTAIFVTHDQEEAFIVGDQVAVMNKDGHIEQQGSPTELYTMPQSRWVADFVGHANLIKGVVSQKHAKTFLGDIELLEPQGEDGTPVDILLRPEDLIFVEPTSEEDAESTMEISLIEYYGHDTLYRLTGRDEKQIWVRLVDHSRSYALGNKVTIEYVGSAAVSFTNHSSPNSSSPNSNSPIQQLGSPRTYWYAC